MSPFHLISVFSVYDKIFTLQLLLYLYKNSVYLTYYYLLNLNDARHALTHVKHTANLESYCGLKEIFNILGNGLILLLARS